MSYCLIFIFHSLSFPNQWMSPTILILILPLDWQFSPPTYSDKVKESQISTCSLFRCSLSPWRPLLCSHLLMPSKSQTESRWTVMTVLQICTPGLHLVGHGSSTTFSYLFSKMSSSKTCAPQQIFPLFFCYASFETHCHIQKNWTHAIKWSYVWMSSFFSGRPLFIPPFILLFLQV